MEMAYVLYALGGAVLGWLSKRFGLQMPAIPVQPVAPSPATPPANPPLTPGPVPSPADLSPEILSLALLLQTLLAKRQQAAHVEMAKSLLADHTAATG